MCRQGQDVRRMNKTNDDVLKAWTRRHGIYYHNQQPSVRLNPAASRCMQLGMCVCSQHADSSPNSWQLSSNVRAAMATIFWKKKQESSEERRLLEDHCIVLRFALSHEGPSQRSICKQEQPRTDIWLHPGHVHFGNWLFTAMQMGEDYAPEYTLPDAVRLLSAPCQFFDPNLEKVRTATAHYKACLGFTKTWWMSVWRISEVEEHWPVGGTCEQVPVVACAAEPVLVWRGADAEDARRSKKVRIPSAEKGQPGAKKKARAGEAPQQQAENLDDALMLSLECFGAADGEGRPLKVCGVRKRRLLVI